MATCSQLAADAGARVSEAGGNAVDAAVAAALVTISTEPGVCALGSGGFVSVWAPGESPITIDGNVAVPGRGAREKGGNYREVTMEYGGGVTTVVGPASVATPGALAALSAASERYGRLPWSELVAPALDAVRSGFPLPQACHQYLRHSGEPIYSEYEDSRAAVFHEDGTLKEAGDIVRVPHLADSLDAIARHGASCFYTGDLAEVIARFSSDNGGSLTLDDLNHYEPVVRDALCVRMSDWRIATNPPPAVGGVTLAAMLLAMGNRPQNEWTAPEVAHLVDVQLAVLKYRRDRLDLSDNIREDAAELLHRSGLHDVESGMSAPSTVHTSTVDTDGLACAATLSAGYGSGVMPPGTGIWLNNCLGELELNRRGLDAGPPGARLPSNMAPTVARKDNGAAMAIGSPGADRITSAILQSLLNFINLHMRLSDAIAHPRAHVELNNGPPRVAVESGLPVEDIEFESRHFEIKSMFFGGVAATLYHSGHGFTVGADERRSGGMSLTNSRATDNK